MARLGGKGYPAVSPREWKGQSKGQRGAAAAAARKGHPFERGPLDNAVVSGSAVSEWGGEWGAGAGAGGGERRDAAGQPSQGVRSIPDPGNVQPIRTLYGNDNVQPH